MDHDPDYWQAPERFRALFERLRSLGLKASYFPIGDAAKDDTTVAVVIEMPPGFVIMRHAHPCARFEVVVRGTLETEGRVMRPGDVMTSAAEIFYGPSTAGPEGCTTIEIFETAPGVTQRIEQRPDGSIVTVDLEQFDVAFKHLARG